MSGSNQDFRVGAADVAQADPPELLCGHWTFWPLIGEKDALRCDLPLFHGGLHKCWWSPSTGESFSWATEAEKHRREDIA